MNSEDKLLWEAIENLNARMTRVERIHSKELQNIDWRNEAKK